jgi:hypothetical protein
MLAMARVGELRMNASAAHRSPMSCALPLGTLDSLFVYRIQFC